MDDKTNEKLLKLKQDLEDILEETKVIEEKPKEMLKEVKKKRVLLRANEQIERSEV